MLFESRALAREANCNNGIGVIIPNRFPIPRCRRPSLGRAPGFSEMDFGEGIGIGHPAGLLSVFTVLTFDKAMSVQLTLSFLFLFG